MRREVTIGLHPDSAVGGYVTALSDVVTCLCGVVFTDSAAFRVEHAAVTLCMSTGVNQAPLLPFVIGHVTQGTAVRHLLLHAQVTQDVNVRYLYALGFCKAALYKAAFMNFKHSIYIDVNLQACTQPIHMYDTEPRNVLLLKGDGSKYLVAIRM